MKPGCRYVNAAFCLILYCYLLLCCRSLFFQVLLRIFYQHSTAKSCGVLMGRRVGNRRNGTLVFVNKIQVQGEEQEVERKEVGDFTDSLFHTNGFSVFLITRQLAWSGLGCLDSATKVESDK